LRHVHVYIYIYIFCVSLYYTITAALVRSPGAIMGVQRRFCNRSSVFLPYFPGNWKERRGEEVRVGERRGEEREAGEERRGRGEERRGVMC